MRKRKGIPNPHDAFFRRTMARPRAVAEFLRLYLPTAIVARLDLSLVHLEDASFVDEKLREHFSDLFYRVGLKEGGEAFVYFLLEHKSAPDERVAIQLLRYLAQAWDRIPLPLPLIIPVVIYHGAVPWNVGERLSSLFTKPAGEQIWRRYLPDFEYHLCDLSRFRDEELAGNEGLSAALKLLKYIFRRELPEKLPGIFRELAGALPEQEAATQVETMVSYLTESQRVTERQISKALFEAAEGGRMETVLDKMRQQWRFEGQQEGQRKGKQIGAVEVALGQLRLKVGRLNRATVEQIQALPVASLKRLGKALLQFKSRADLDAWLRRSAARSARKL
ncbi:MAG: Rpn family recombination-promoting nuclease/putative transposase [Blastocatellia bacterium]